MEKLKQQILDYYQISSPFVQILNYGSYVNIATDSHVFITKLNQLPNKIGMKLSKLLAEKRRIIL